MRWVLLQSLLVASAPLVTSAPSAATEPCGQIAAAVKQATLLDLNGNPLIDADLTYACLQSVPVDKVGNLKLLKGYQTAVNFQSDLVYLKDPPPGYLYPGVDVLGVLNSISTKLQNDGYSNEYEFHLELWELITSAYDFHMTYNPDILSNVFSWLRGFSLISVSVDGSSLPNVYVFSDLAALNGLNQTTYKASPVVKINNTDVETWLNQYAALEPWDHDPDANYNNIFINIPSTSNSFGYGSSFSQNFKHFPGRSTILTLANGTTLDVPSYAAIYGDFTGVTDGETFFQKFCVPSPASVSASVSASVVAPSIPFASFSFSVAPSLVYSKSFSGSATPSSVVASSSVTTYNLYTPLASETPIPAPYAYPEPAVIAPDNSISGYFPEAQDDLAVLSLPTFGPESDFIFQNKVRTFLATAKSLGKKRLIIDIRSNGGGTVSDGFSIFKELFPSMEAFGGSNMAAWPLFDIMGQIASEGSDKETEEIQPLSEFDVSENLNVKGTDYETWSDFYGPVEHHGGQFTNVRRYNYSSPYNSLGNAVYGYVNGSAPQPQTFQPENIVMLSDGFCGSTCAIVSELMKTQVGVQSIAVGGRKQYGPMQSVGGSKGSNDQQIYNLFSTVTTLAKSATDEQLKLFEPYAKAGLQENAEQLLQRVGSSANVNFQNNLRKGDDSATPLMFVYEAANCRFFYTPQMISDQSLVWAQAYNLQWGKGDCVKDSTGHPSAETGFDPSYFNSEPPDSAKNFFGATVKWSYPAASESSSTPSVSSAAPSATSIPPPPRPATDGAGSLQALTLCGTVVVALCCAVLI